MSVSSGAVGLKVGLPNRASSSKIDSLPKEVLGRIFSFLGESDIEAATLATRRIHPIMKDAANFGESDLIKPFIEVLIYNLSEDLFFEERDLLLEILNSINSNDFGSLTDLKLQLINAIKMLDDETVNRLKESVTFPGSFEDIFELAGFQRKIDEIDLMANSFFSHERFENFLDNLAQVGKADRVRDLQHILGNLVKTCKIERTSAAAASITRETVIDESIQNPILRGIALQEICKFYRKHHLFMKATLVAKMIPNKTMKSYALYHLAKYMEQVGNISGAIAVARLIDTRKMRKDVFLKIYDSLNEATIGGSWPDPSSIEHEIQ